MHLIRFKIEFKYLNLGSKKLSIAYEFVNRLTFRFENLESLDCRDFTRFGMISDGLGNYF